MGGISRAVKKISKKVTKPIKKITKGIARGIAKVGKGVMKGVAKLNKKMGPLGMIAMSIAMPYALQGLGAGFTKLSVANQGNSFGTFLNAVRSVGTKIKTGYSTLTGNIGSMIKNNPISNTIRKTFSNFSNSASKNKLWKSVSNGAKRLYQAAKDITPKFRKGTSGSVDVWNVRGSPHTDGGIWSSMKSSQAESLIKAAEAAGKAPPILRGQSLGTAEGWFTQAGSSKADEVVTKTINKALEDKVNLLDTNGKRYFNDLISAAKNRGEYVNSSDALSKVLEGNHTIWEGTDFDGKFITDLSKTGDYNYIKGGMRPNPHLESGQSISDAHYRFTGDKSFDNPVAKKYNYKKAIDKTANIIKKSGLLDQNEIIHPEKFDLISSASATANESQGGSLTSTDIKGSTGTDYFKKVYGEAAWQKLKGYHRNMNYQGHMDYYGG